ncbi:MAG: GIY-YIG nuclease family protein, partial [Bacteroidota bacterium]
MFFVYALKSLNRNYIYVGLTSNFVKRLTDHQM